MSERVVVIGSSHAAHSVIETLKREGFQGKLTLISEEKMPPCSPTALPYLLWEREKSRRFLRPPEFYRDLEVIEKRALSIDPEKGVVVLGNGKKTHYDRLVIATGASAAHLPVQSSKKNPVLTLRRIDDLGKIEERVQRSQRILLVGAGLIGLHLAQVFLKGRREVHVIEVKDQILPGLIPPEIAALLKSLFEQNGIRVSLGVSVSETGEKEATLSSGEKVRMDLAIACVGIRTNLEVVKETPIGVREGVLVNDRMETNIPGIYACGDVAEYKDFFTGENRLNPNVVSAAEQGKCVAEHIVGKGTSHPGLISINTFNCFGLSLLSLGRFMPGPEDRILEESDSGKMVYKRMVYREDRLKGVVSLNSAIGGGIFYRLVREKVSLKDLEEKLLKDPFLWGKWVAEKTSDQCK